jgi:ferritin-like protein
MAESAGLHEARELLSADVVDRHRANVSLQEELDAIDWYDQRVSATDDRSLADVLAHNRDEEKEHAAMTLEWLRRRDRALDAALRTYLFTESPIVEEEHEAGAGGGEGSSAGAPPSADGSLGIGGLRGR